MNEDILVEGGDGVSLPKDKGGYDALEVVWRGAARLSTIVGMFVLMFFMLFSKLLGVVMFLGLVILSVSLTIKDFREYMEYYGEWPTDVLDDKDLI